MKKRILAVALIMAMTVSMTACGNKKKSKEADTPVVTQSVPEAADTPVVTEAPVATETPTATEVPTATEIPSVTDAAPTDTPVSTPEVTEEPTVTDAVPTAEPTPTEEPTVAPTDTPVPTEVPVPTETPVPTEIINTPIPTEIPTPEPTENPSPVQGTSAIEQMLPTAVAFAKADQDKCGLSYHAYTGRRRAGVQEDKVNYGGHYYFSSNTMDNINGDNAASLLEGQLGMSTKNNAWEIVLAMVNASGADINKFSYNRESGLYGGGGIIPGKEFMYMENGYTYRFFVYQNGNIEVNKITTVPDDAPDGTPYRSETFALTIGINMTGSLYDFTPIYEASCMIVGKSYPPAS